MKNKRFCVVLLLLYNKSKSEVSVDLNETLVLVVIMRRLHFELKEKLQSAM